MLSGGLPTRSSYMIIPKDQTVLNDLILLLLTGQNSMMKDAFCLLTVSFEWIIGCPFCFTYFRGHEFRGS